MLMNLISAELNELENLNLLRRLEIPHGIDFSSNDYLGYSQNTVIQQQLLRFLENQLSRGGKLGSTGSRLISGHSAHLEETETFLAQCFRVEAVLFFGSGYLANIGVLSALGASEFFSDELNHASIIDGIRLSKSKAHIFKHHQMEHLDCLLSQSHAQRKVIVTESIFSMDGDRAPIEDLINLSQKHRAMLVVDEAHATGTCGNKNLGLMAHQKIDAESVIVIHTGGKALGGYGAFVGCSHQVKKFLLNKARSQIFSTALPPLMIEQIRLSIQQLISDSTSTHRLWDNIKYTQQYFDSIKLQHSGSPIVPMIIGSNFKVIEAAQRLQAKGLFVKGIRSPSVPAGSERLRITLKATHQLAELDQLCLALLEIKDEFICGRN